MSFISIEFVVLLSLVIFFVAKSTSQISRKILVLLASAIFYAWWDWRFLGLLAFITILDYCITKLLISTKKKQQKYLLIISIIVNISLLAYFKYFNFFIESLNPVMDSWGWQLNSLEIILPIGISFYIFETLSYVIDVYRGIAKPASRLLDYAIFISFFPRLVAGPIMRASQFLPQLEKGIQIKNENLVEGTQLFLRGTLKKLVVADNLAIMVDLVYSSPGAFSSLTVWLGVFAYAVQILFDFWGYTDMAIGIGKMLGFVLPINFDLPYVSQSITEFWTRWHISLSTWLRDYLYIPLGGNRRGKIRTNANMLITMLLGGLWHGASWNFVIWGGLHGLYLSLERLIYGAKPSPHSWSSPIAYLRSLATFVLVAVTWVPFRSPSFQTTMKIMKKLLFFETEINFEWYFVWALIFVPTVFFGGWLAAKLNWKWPIFSTEKSITLAFILFEILLIFFFAPLNTSPFIYFQF